MIVIYILLILLAILLYYKIYHTTEYFSNIDDDISHGNPISRSDIPNQYVDANQRIGTPPLTYQGDGLPLLHETHSTTPVDHSMFYFNERTCRPECCMYSPYSCSNGCVCWTSPPLDLVAQNNEISPRS